MNVNKLNGSINKLNKDYWVFRFIREKSCELTQPYWDLKYWWSVDLVMESAGHHHHYS